MTTPAPSTDRHAGGEKSYEANLSQHKADLYNKNASFVYSAAFAGPVLTLLDAQPGQKILDLGCGTGELTDQIRQAVGSEGVVWGTDSNEEMLAKAGTTFPELKPRLWQADAQSLGPLHPGLPENSFDTVFTNAVLHWCKRDPSGVLQGVKRCLKPGGKFVGEMGGFMCLIGIRSHLHQILSSPPYNLSPKEFDPWFFPTPKHYRRLLEDAGFKVKSIENVPRPNPLPQGLMGWLEVFARRSFLSSLGDEDAKGVMEEVCRRCEVDFRDEEGGWEVMYMRLRFVAVLE